MNDLDEKEQIMLKVMTKRYMRFETIFHKLTDKNHAPQTLINLQTKGMIERNPDIYSGYDKYRLTLLGSKTRKQM